MKAESEDHQKLWEGTDRKAVRAILNKAKKLEAKSYEEAFKELGNCYEHLSVPMGGHEPMQEVNYEFLYWSSLAFIYLALEQDDQLIQTCEVLSHKFPKKLEVLRILVHKGTTFRELGKYDKAEKIFQLARQIIKKFDEANEDLNKIQAEILSNQSLICIDTSTYSLAIQKMGNAIEKDPQHFEYLCIIPSFYIGSKDYDKMQRQLEHCRKRICQDPGRLKLKKYTTMLIHLDYWETEVERLKEISSKPVINRQIMSYIDLIDSCSSIPQEEQEELRPQTEAAILQDQTQNKKPAARLKNQIQADYQFFQSQGNQNLLYFYNGFSFAFQSSYTQAKLMAFGKFTVNPENLKVSIASKIAKFIPFFGELVSTAIDKIGNYVTERQLITMSKNICNLSPFNFNGFAQEVLVEIIKKHETFLKELDQDIPVIKDWPNFFIRLIEYLKLKKEQLQDKIFGQSSLLKNQIEKYGYYVASKLISSYVANGDIYDEPSKREKRAHIIKKLIAKTTQMIDQDIQLYNSKDQIFWRKIKRSQNKEKKKRKSQIVMRKPIPPTPIPDVSFFAKLCSCFK